MSRNTRICFWVNETEKQHIQKMAQIQGLNLSEYLRLVSQGYLSEIDISPQIDLQPLLEQLKEIRAEIMNLQPNENSSNPFESQIVDSLLQIWTQSQPKSFSAAEESIEFDFQREYVFDAIIALEEKGLARINVEKEWIKWIKKK